MLFEYEVNQTIEAIESVSLVVDGEIVEERFDEPYSFVMIPDEPKDYYVYALVRDKAGNLSSSEETTISVQRFSGGGVSVFLNMENRMVFEADDQILLSAQASSQYGVNEVEFFIDMKSVGKITQANGQNYQLLVDLEELGMNLGEHQVSVIVRDNQGNQAGTFDPWLTNINARQNKTFVVNTSQVENPPAIELLSPMDGLSVPLGSSLRLQTLAEDFAGGEVTGVQFYVNQELQTLWLGIFEFLELDAPQYDDLALVLDDGSDRDEVTFVFDTDRVLSNGGGEVDQPIGRSSNMYPNGLSLDSSTNYTGVEYTEYLIEIDGTGSPNTFRWSRDGGLTFSDEKVAITQSAQEIEHGIHVVFANKSGHQRDDSWTVVARPTAVVVSLLDTPSDEIDIAWHAMPWQMQSKNTAPLDCLLFQPIITTHQIRF